MSIANTLLDIGQKSKVFMDNYMIETCEAITRTMHQPVRYSGNHQTGGEPCSKNR